jgi:hypothetical protein
MSRLQTRDDCAFLIGKALTDIGFDKSHVELRFDQDVRIKVQGTLEHRVHTDILGRAAPGRDALPSLLRLVGMPVRQVGVEPHYLLLAFDDGHEVRLFVDDGGHGFEIAPAEGSVSDGRE